MSEVCEAAMLSDDVLTEVSWDQVPQILAEMRTEWPRSLVAYNMLSNAYAWRAKEPEKTFQVLRPSSGLTGIYIIFIPRHKVEVVLWARGDALGALGDLLPRTGMFDRGADEVLFCGLDGALHQALLGALREKGIRASYVEHCTAYWMPARQAAALRTALPDGAHLSQLDDTHAELINSRWTYGTRRTLGLVRDILRLNPSWGVFLGDSPQPVAWCLKAEYGVGMLHTEGPHRGKGYARAVAARMFRQLGEEGEDVHLHVERSNATAHWLFRELGCLSMGDVFWTELAPKPLAAR